MGINLYGLAWDNSARLAWAKLGTTVGWDHVVIPATPVRHGIWYEELSIRVVSIFRLHRGGFGRISDAE